MKLFIVTQIVDRNDPVLGFFIEWVRFLASEVESIELVGLKVGEYDVPENVTVHTLGKESGPQSSLVYSWRLAALAWRLRHKTTGLKQSRYFLVA